MSQQIATELTAEAVKPRKLPWSLGDLARLLRFEIVAFVAIVGCFVGARQTKSWNDELYWIVGAIAALLLAGAGWVAWLVVGARALRERQRRLVELASSPEATPNDDPVLTGALVSNARMRHYHRSDCLLVAGKDVTRASAREHVKAGRVACGVCTP